MVIKEKFCNDVFDKARVYYKDRAKVTMHDVTKNNSLSKKGLCVTMIGGNCGPTIYLDEYYEDYAKGKSFESVFNDIISMLDMHLIDEKVDVSFFTDFDKIYDKICFRLVGAGSNKERLEGCPHRLIEDLAVTYFISLTSMGIQGSVAIKNVLMKIWNATEEDLFEAALDNTPRLYPAKIISMNEFMEQKTGSKVMPGDFFSKELLKGSNEQYTNGASVLLYPGVLEEIGEHVNGNFYVIPSSVHEVLFVKELSYGDEPGTLEYMIKSVNSSCVLPEEVLSDSLYYYDRAVKNSIKKVELVKDTMLL